MICTMKVISSVVGFDLIYPYPFALNVLIFHKTLHARKMEMPLNFRIWAWNCFSKLDFFLENAFFFSDFHSKTVFNIFMLDQEYYSCLLTFSRNQDLRIVYTEIIHN